MDEPLSNLDAKMRVSTRAELQKLHRRLGVTTIYVTHDQVEAMTMGDRIAVMKDGVLQQLDTPQRIYRHPSNVFVAGFIGSPAMNLMTVTVETGEAGVYLQGQGFRLRVPEPHAQRLADRKGSQVLFGIRPEHIDDARFRRDADPDTIVMAQVDVVEPLGGDVNIYAVIGEGQSIVAHLDDRTETWPGQAIKLAFDMPAMNAFDPVSQASLL
jgi:multiple sugar transport system ATP-binding protein